jgi:hypothetical protein
MSRLSVGKVASAQRLLGTALESKTGPNWGFYELPVVGGVPMTSRRNILLLLRFQVFYISKFLSVFITLDVK